MFQDDVPSFFQLMDEHFDFQQFIPSTFSNAFYQSLGRTRLYPLEGFLSALVLQKIFSIPTDSLLLLFLNLCRELRDFCGFSKVPDASLMSRFKHGFEPYIEQMFQLMVIILNPSARLWMLPSPGCSLLTPPALSSMSLKITQRPSTP